jgi:hypothetical protein
MPGIFQKIETGWLTFIGDEVSAAAVHARHQNGGVVVADKSKLIADAASRGPTELASPQSAAAVAQNEAHTHHHQQQQQLQHHTNAADIKTKK